MERTLVSTRHTASLPDQKPQMMHIFDLSTMKVLSSVGTDMAQALKELTIRISLAYGSLQRYALVL